MKYYIPVAAALLLMAGSATAETIDEIIKEIELNNLELRSTEAENNASSEETRASNLPGATSIEFNPFFGHGGIASSEFIVKQDFDFPTLYTSRRRLGKAQDEELGASASELRRRIAADARKKLIELCMFRSLDSILMERINLNKRLQEGISKKENLKQATAADAALSRLDAIDLKNEHIRNLTSIHMLERELTAMNGGKNLSLDNIESPQPTMNIPDGSTLKDLMEKSGSVRKADAALRSSREEVSVARNGWAPGLSLGYRMETEGKSAAHGMMIGLGFDLFGTAGKVKAAQSRQKAAVLQAETSRISQASEMEAIVTDMSRTLQLMQLYVPEELEKTGELLDLAINEGSITIEEYCEGMDKLLTRKSEYEKLRYELALLEAELYK